ncbi:trypsin-like serine protease [Pseudomonas sp. MS646]|uniref:trypsin-like serine protease n=1 Tax=Pseudomonas sp. MS646 TaxID=3118751 RepID=UPI0030D0D504
MRKQSVYTACLLLAFTGSTLAIMKIAYVPYKTMGKNNLPVLFGHTFTNEYNPSASTKFDPQKYTQIIAEATQLGCRGGDGLSTQTNKPHAVLSCFQKNNGEDKKTTIIYNKLKDGITSITFDSSHFCMASYAGNGKWVTAGHCFSGKTEPYENYKILLDKAYSIKVTNCGPLNCDIATVEAIGSKLSETPPAPIIGDLSSVSEETPLFIPGIEIGTKIPGNNLQGVSQVVMWSKIKNACIPYEVKHGCIAYTCSTLTGFSGSPVYSISADYPKLVGVHSGVELGGSCTNHTVNLAVTTDIFAGMLK